jgi:hypothetical protein
MTHTTAHNAQHEVLSTQEIALHMIASAARVLLIIGTAVLVGEVAVGPASTAGIRDCSWFAGSQLLTRPSL